MTPSSLSNQRDSRPLLWCGEGGLRTEEVLRQPRDVLRKKLKRLRLDLGLQRGKRAAVYIQP